MRNLALILGLTTALTAVSADSFAAAGSDYSKWLVRGRAIVVAPDESADIGVIGGDVSIDTSVVPELDITYFFTKNIAAELILGTTPHDVTAKGTALGNLDLGSVWLLPPTLTLQYHFDAGNGIRPYLGAGINYTIFYGEDEGSSITSIDYDPSFGGALQAGVDVDINNKWVFNVDVKKIWINTDVTVNGAVPADVDINPWVFGVGVGYKF